MTNDIETVEQVCEEFKTPKYTCENCDFKICPSINVFSDRVLAAHKREVAELRECLREAVTEVCNRLEKCGFKEPCVFKTCYVQKWRKVLHEEVGSK